MRKNKKIFGVWLDEKLQKRLKVYCIQNDITIEKFVTEVLIDALTPKPRLIGPDV